MQNFTGRNQSAPAANDSINIRQRTSPPPPGTIDSNELSADRSRSQQCSHSYDPELARRTLRSPGQPLDPEARAILERFYDADFSSIRVHTDEQAAASARSVAARAYTAGRHIVFGAGRYTPGSSEGRRLLAHELAHAVQQRRTPDLVPLDVSPKDNLAESEAERAASSVPEIGIGRTDSISDSLKWIGASHLQLTPVSGQSLARSPEDEDPGGGRDPREAVKIGGAQGEREEAGRARRELADKGYDEIYEKRQMGRSPKMKRRPGPMTWLEAAFPDARHRPDMIAIDRERKRILVLDFTAGPWSLTNIKPGDRRKLPADAPGGVEQKPHLEKTIEDARQLARNLPPHLADYEVVAQDRYWKKGGYSVEVRIATPKVAPPGDLGGAGGERRPRTSSGPEPASQPPPAQPGPQPTTEAPEAHKPPSEQPTAHKPVVDRPAKKPTTPEATIVKPEAGPTGDLRGPEGEAHPRTSSGPEPHSQPPPARPGPHPTTEAPEAHKPPSKQPTAHKPVVDRPAKRSTTPNLDAEGPARAAVPRSPKTTGARDIGPSAVGHGGSRLTELTEGGAADAASAVIAAATDELARLAEQNPGDKELAKLVDTVNKGLEVKSLLDNPKNFVADKLKTALTQGVFNYAYGVLSDRRQDFENEFPDVSTLRRDPLDTGVSLSEYARTYNDALVRLKIPDGRRALFYIAALYGLDKDAPQEEVERRIAAANQELAKLPGLREYAEKYYDARDRYNFALLSVQNQLLIRKDRWTSQTTGLANEIISRGKALQKAASALRDASMQLLASPAIALPVMGPAILNLRQELEGLSERFDNLGNEFERFGESVRRRKAEYDHESARIGSEFKRIAKDTVQPLSMR